MVKISLNMGSDVKVEWCSVNKKRGEREREREREREKERDEGEREKRKEKEWKAKRIEYNLSQRETYIAPEESKILSHSPRSRMKLDISRRTGKEDRGKTVSKSCHGEVS